MKTQPNKSFPEVSQQVISEVFDFVKSSTKSIESITTNGQKTNEKLRFTYSDDTSKALDGVLENLSNPNLTQEERERLFDRQDQLLDREERAINQQNDENIKERNYFVQATQCIAALSCTLLGYQGVKEAKKYIPKIFPKYFPK